jgi:hypothetical protein
MAKMYVLRAVEIDYEFSSLSAVDRTNIPTPHCFFKSRLALFWGGHIELGYLRIVKWPNLAAGR